MKIDEIQTFPVLVEPCNGYMEIALLKGLFLFAPVDILHKITIAILRGKD